MSGVLGPLLDLRRLRERQAAGALSQATGRLDAQTAQLAEMERRQAALAVASRQRIADLYAGTVDTGMGPGALDRLVLAIDEQYLIQAQMAFLVEAHRRRREAMAAEVDTARGVLNERRRNVQKLEFLAEEIGRSEAAAAEIRAEAEAERPHPTPPGARHG